MSAGYPDGSDAVHAVPTFYGAMGAPRSAPFGTAERPIPVIIDSDPGLDDALAIGLAVARPELDVLAVTTVGGNADVRHCTDNALRLLHAYGRDDIPVAEGAAGPLVGDVVRATEVHGEGGIGTTRLPPATATVRPEGAVELIAQLLRETLEPVAIAPIGPLTNIALLLRLHPELASRIAHLSIMGGSIGEGNTTVSAEFNIYADPEAADIVFRSGVPITMMGLDVTHQALLDRSAADALRATGTTSGRIAAELTDFALERNMEWSGRTTTAIHDAVAVAHLAIPDLIDVAPYHVVVDTTDGPARGRTVADGLPYRLRRDGLDPNAEIGIRIDPRRFESLLIEAFGSCRRHRMRYVALGDSYTIGTAVAPAEAFPEQLVCAHPELGLDLVANLGVNGHTTADLIRDQLPALHAAAPELVTLLIGVNDVVQGIPAVTYEANVVHILDVLQARLPSNRIVTIAIPDYTVTPAGADYGDPDDQHDAIVAENAIMARLARAREMAFVDIFDVSVRAAEDRSLVADDGLHPSGAQYALWVERIAPVVAGLLRGDG